MKIFKSDFIGSFKLGDNIAYNFNVLRVLYDSQRKFPVYEQQMLLKPIILTISSIAEAILFDLYLRIKCYTKEGVPCIPEEVLEEIRSKTIDEFAKYITNSKSKRLLGEDMSIYEDLDDLRKLRNRIHIQNLKNHFERDESSAFSEQRLLNSEKTLEALLGIMISKYTRENDYATGHVPNFSIPWNPHNG